MIENERFVRKGYKIWDTLEGEEVYQLHYRYEVDDICDMMNDYEKEKEQLKSEYEVLHTQYQDLKNFVENNFDEYLTQEKLNRQIITLSDENEQLKDILKDITIQLDANHTMNNYQMVVPINKVIYNELNRRLKETSFKEELRRFLDD